MHKNILLTLTILISTITLPFAQVSAAAALLNPGFEAGTGTQPENWVTETIQEPASYLWDTAEKHSGDRSVKVTVSGEGIARWAQDVSVDLNSEYELTGWIKTENAAGEGARILAVGSDPFNRLLGASTTRILGTQDWTQVSVKFITGTAPLARIGCSVGVSDYLLTATPGSGTAWCDDLTLTKLRELPRTQTAGQHAILDVYSEEHEDFSDPEAYVALLDEVYLAMQDLVGSQPYSGAKISARSNATMFYTALSGNPIAVAPGKGYSGGGDTLADFVNRHGIDFAVPHEFGHDFDLDPEFHKRYIGSQRFDNAEHWANFKLLFAFDQVAAQHPDLTMDIFDAVVPLSQVGQRFVDVHAQPWIDQGRTDIANMQNDVYTGLLYTLVKQVGWVPFKATFREYSALAAANAPVPDTDIKKVELFANILSQKAGKDLIPAFKSWGFAIQNTSTPNPDPEEVAVPVDIKPQSCPSTIKTRSDTYVTVLVAGTKNFNVKKIDPKTLRLRGVKPVSWQFKDVSRPFSPFLGKDSPRDCVDQDDDDITDLVLKFRVKDLLNAVGSYKDGSTKTFRLRGNLLSKYDSTKIVGEDIVTIRKR